MRPAILLCLLVSCAPPATPPDAGEPCVKPGDPAANAKGVGLPCTKGGDECAPFLDGFGDKAWICTVDGEPTAEEFFCTMPCETDDFCGPNAVCTGDKRGKGCTPSRCVKEDGGNDAGDAGDAADGGGDASDGGGDASDGGDAADGSDASDGGGDAGDGGDAADAGGDATTD
jgi:hypothetical protein